MPVQYWDDLITQQSLEKLHELNKRYDFVLIGGWAVYLYTRALKSKDIDIIVDFDTLATLKKDFHLNKNERLKKYEIKEELFDVDVYVAHYSDLGIPVEDVVRKTVQKESFSVPTLETLLLLKQEAYEARRGSIKGEKDKIDIISLLNAGINVKKYRALCEEYNRKEAPRALVELLKSAYEIKEIGLNQQMMARLRKKLKVRYRQSVCF